MFGTLVVAGAVMGSGWCSPVMARRMVVEPAPVVMVDRTGAQVARWIETLERCGEWRQRDRAARELRGVSWQRYPEVVIALTRTVARDPHEEVREEAAESLAKLAPCVPEARAVVARAAACDPDHATRKWARRAAAKMADACDDGCRFCEGDEGLVMIRGPVEVERYSPRAPEMAPLESRPGLGPEIYEAPMEPGLEVEPIPPPPSPSIPEAWPEVGGFPQGESEAEPRLEVVPRELELVPPDLSRSSREEPSRRARPVAIVRRGDPRIQRMIMFSQGRR